MATQRLPIAREPGFRARPVALLVVATVTAAVVVFGVANLWSPLAAGFAAAAVVAAFGAAALWTEVRPPRAYARWRDVMPCYLTVQDRTLRIVDTNDVFRRDFGQRLGEHCFAAYKNADAPCPTCPVLRTFADGQVHSSEEVVVAADGSETHMLVTSAPLFDHGGEVSAVVEMSTNVTELRALERELDQSRRDYKRLFEAVPCYICVQDRDHTILEANTLYREEFGVSPQSRCYEICKERPSPCPECIVQQTFEDGAGHSSEETLHGRDGRHIHAVAHTWPIRDENGATVAVMEVFTDITEVRHLERQLTLMGRAVAGMAHRIKNILMGLEGGIFVVNTGLEAGDREAMAEGWEMVQRNVARVARIVKDLLYCSKARQPVFRDGVCPGAVVREVAELFRGRMADEDITLRLEVDERTPCGRFDPDSLHNLLSNLVANAIDGCRFDPDESKPGHCVVLRCRPGDDSQVVIEVEDDGVGIPEELEDKVFEEYFSSKGSEGTGIGLLVVQKVAHEHGGRVVFSSTPGQRTAFSVILPTTPASEPPA